MRRAERQITDRSEIDAIVRAARVMRLGLVDGLEPYVVPLSFGYDGVSLYFHCAAEGRKIDIIRRGARVCFEMDQLIDLVEAPQACAWGARYQSVVGTGRAVILDDPQAKRRGLQHIMAQYSSGRFDFPDRNLSRTCVVRVDIEGITGKQSTQ